MTTVRSSSNRNRLVAAAGTVLVLAIIVIASALLSPRTSRAQGGAPDQSEPGPAPTSPLPPPPPALQLNPPTPTPETGASQATAGAQGGGSDLEVVRFRPDITLRRGEVLLGIAPEKSDGPTDSDSIERPAGEAGGPQDAYQAPDISGVLTPLDWNLLVYEDFEGAFPGAWILEDFSDDGYDRTWGDTSYLSQWGYWSAWPAAGGVNAVDPYYYYYPYNLNSWMEYGPLDFSNMTDIFVSFGLWYQTEPLYDRMYFCASIDFVHYNCDYWSGDSRGWTDQAYWLTSYAGYQQVWLAWVFQSDDSIVDDGPFVDEVVVWGYDTTAIPTPTPTPDPAGELVQNGSFETGDLTHWDSHSSGSASALEGDVEGAVEGRPPLPPGSDGKRDVSSMGSVEGAQGVASVGVTDSSAVDGKYSAYLWQDGYGNDFLYQTIDVPFDVTDVVLNYWFGVTTYETAAGNDWFCVSLSDPDNHGDIWIDLGCMDAAYTTGYWQQVLYTLDDSEVAVIKGRQVDFVFELYNRGGYGTGTAGWADYVRVYATGGGAGSHVDPNEPNDGPGSATAITCGETISGTIGDAMGEYGDMDWFELSNVPPGQLDIDIKADTQVPPSALDSVVGLWDSSLDLLTWNDDDGVSYDSYVTYTVESADTFYISVESYSGYGGPYSSYGLTAQCADGGTGPPPGGTDPTSPLTDTWTLMLYLNAEDRSFEQTLRKYITDMETVLNGKTDFLTVTVLYDGPNDGDTTRYLLQPDGAYIDGVNRWALGEQNMGDPDTLADFANWAMDQYPAENHYLAIDDHGHGVYGISWDQTNGDDALTPPELYSALKDITRNGARKIDILDYEACLMGMAETAYDVREWVDYVVFFEQISWGINTYPVYFSDLAPTHTPLTVGTRIVNRYHAQADNEGYPHTISLIRTDVMTDVKQTITNFGTVLSATVTMTQVNTVRSDSQAFAADNDATNPDLADYIDLYDLAAKAKSAGFASAQANSVQNAVQNAVGAFQDYTAPRLFQMSIYESDINNDGRWDEFLLWAVGTGGNGTSGGIGDDDRRGMNGFRFLQPKLGGDSSVYLPLVLRR